MMLFSVIIPAFNVGRYIEKTLASLEGQTIKPNLFEVIIVNDGSTDDTAAIVSRFISRGIINIKFFDQENMGVSSARNLGIKKATGHYLYFLDGDDYIAADFLFLLSEVIRDKNPQLLITSYNKVIGSEAVQSFVIKNKHQSAEDIQISYLKGNIQLHLCTFVFRREEIIKWNLSFDVKTRFGEDLEFYQKFLFSSSQIAVVNTAYFYYVYRPCSTFNKPAGLKREDALFALYRVRKYLVELTSKSELLDAFQLHFFPDHVLKVIYRLVLEGRLGNATYVAKKHGEILKGAKLDGRRLLKAKLAYFFPWFYVLLIFSIHKARRGPSKAMRSVF